MCLLDGVSAVHLWRYRGGYPALTEVMNKLRQNEVIIIIIIICSCVVPSLWSWSKVYRLVSDQDFTKYRKERGKMLLSRRNQLLLEFSFWNEPVPRDGPNIYELRSYQLRVSPTDRVMSGFTTCSEWLLSRFTQWDSCPVKTEFNCRNQAHET